MSIIKEIVDWQTSRGLNLMPYNHVNETKNILEEMFEGWMYINNTPRGLAEISLQLSNADSKEVEDSQKVDNYCDAIVYAVGAIMKLGYDPEKALKECVKEINDRTGSYDPVEGKWCKQPDKEDAYKADYKKALSVLEDYSEKEVERG